MTIELPGDLARELEPVWKSAGAESLEQFCIHLLEMQAQAYGISQQRKSQPQPPGAASPVATSETLVTVMPKFFLASKDGTSTEEVSLKKVNDGIRSGEITRKSVLWDERVRQWCPAGEIDLFVPLLDQYDPA
jgi:hypothetical protein